MCSNESQQSKRPPFLIPALIISIIGITAFVYSLSLSAGFVNWDDLDIVVNNVFIRSFNASSLKWMFTTFDSGNWIPLTWVTHAAVYHFWKLNPEMHHLINVVIHCCNAILVFYIFSTILSLIRKKEQEPAIYSQRAILMTAWLAATIWSIHPLNVESVAWVTEVKGLGCAFFFFLSILVYLQYCTSVSKRFLALSLSFGCFILSLLFKPMSITLPLVLVLLDVWPLRRLIKGSGLRIFLEKLPFFLTSLVFSLVVVRAQASLNAVAGIERLPFPYRIMNAFHSIAFYLQKIFMPLRLVPFYPYPGFDKVLHSFGYVAAPLVVIIITLACIAWSGKKKAYMLTAWVFFIVTLIPVLGIIQVGSQAAADRYTYIPSTSIILLFSAWFISRSRELLKPVSLIPVAIIIFFGFSTMKQIGIWKDSLTLWQYVAKIYPNSSRIITGNLGLAYLEVGDKEEAIAMFDKTLELSPDDVLAYNNLGLVYQSKGDYDKAMYYLNRAIKISPDYANAYYNRAIVYYLKQEYALAKVDAYKAEELGYEVDPKFLEGLMKKTSGREK